MEKENNKNKIYFLVRVVITLLFVIIVNFITSKANYRKTENIPLAKGTINYTLVDFEIVEITIDGKPSNKMPTGNYELTSESYCTEKNDQFKDTKNENIKLTYQDNILSVSNYTKKGTKCHLVFEELKVDLLAELKAKSNGKVGSITGPSCDLTSENCGTSGGSNMKQVGVYETEDNDGTSYYYRGSVTNNWVKFGTDDNNIPVWWRIVRVNGDGTIRLIYAGTNSSSPSPTGSGTMVAAEKAYNSNVGDNTYVGFYYGYTRGSYPNNHSNTNKSTIVTEIESWYNGKGWAAEKYENYIDPNAGFCNDRTIHPQKGTWWTNESGNDGSRGAGIIITAYGPFSRIFTQSGNWNTTQTPTLLCGKKTDGTDNEVSESDYKRDLFTIGNSSKGNNALGVPAGLITVDEIIFAGGFGGQNNTNYYLYNNQNFWTMSPSLFSSNALAFRVNNNGTIESNSVIYTDGVRPVINLKADTTFTTNGVGDKGTINNPYIVG